MTEEDDKKRLRLIGVFMTIPFVLALPPIIGWWFGSWLDGKFGTEPYLMYLWILLGFVAGFREMFRIIRRFGEE